MWESDGSAIMGDNVWNSVLANTFFDDLAELESGFLSINTVRIESSFDIHQYSEMFIGFSNSNNVHLTERVSVISSALSIDLN